MSSIDHANRQALDRDIMTFVRESARMAPVTFQAINLFVRDIRRRMVSPAEIKDRMTYLEAAGYLEQHRDWQAGEGELIHYTITADGMDVMDGVKPPRGWTAK